MLIDKSAKKNYYLITLLTIDPDDPEKTRMMELDPMTVEAGVFMDKECKIPCPISDPRYHITPEIREMMHISPIEGGFVTLDANGWIPMEYMDKHLIACYFEFANVTEMLANNDFDPVAQHGRMVMVRDFSDEPGTDIPDEFSGMWAIYRLEGNNPREFSSWHRIFFEAHFREYVRWEDLDHGIQSTVLEIDKMVQDSHAHINYEVLRALTVNEDGKLVFNGHEIMNRDEFIAIGILTNYPYTNMRVGDFGHDVTYSGEYVPTSDTDSDGNTYLVGDVSGYYENDTTLIEPKKINVTGAEKMNRFFKGCSRLETIPFMDTANVKEADEFCADCVWLYNLATLNFNKCVTMHHAFLRCFALNSIPSMDLRNCENVECMFADCHSVKAIGEMVGHKIKYARGLFYHCYELEALPEVDLSQVEDLSNLCTDCAELDGAHINSSSAKNLSEAFKGCFSMKTVEVDISSYENIEGIFDGCDELTNITLHGQLKDSFDFSNTKISLESATAIVDNLPVVTGYHALTFTGTPGSKVNSISVAQAERKGWTIIR